MHSPLQQETRRLKLWYACNGLHLNQKIMPRSQGKNYNLSLKKQLQLVERSQTHKAFTFRGFSHVLLWENQEHHECYGTLESWRRCLKRVTLFFRSKYENQLLTNKLDPGASQATVSHIKQQHSYTNSGACRWWDHTHLFSISLLDFHHCCVWIQAQYTVARIRWHHLYAGSLAVFAARGSSATHDLEAVRVVLAERVNRTHAIRSLIARMPAILKSHACLSFVNRTRALSVHWSHACPPQFFNRTHAPRARCSTASSSALPSSSTTLLDSYHRPFWNVRARE